VGYSVFVRVKMNPCSRCGGSIIGDQDFQGLDAVDGSPVPGIKRVLPGKKTKRKSDIFISIDSL